MGEHQGRSSEGGAEGGAGPKQPSFHLAIRSTKSNLCPIANPSHRLSPTSFFISVNLQLQDLFFLLNFTPWSIKMKHSKYAESSPGDSGELPPGISVLKQSTFVPRCNGTDEMKGMCCHFYRSPYRFQDAFVNAIQDDFKYSSPPSTSSQPQLTIVQ